ncbi:phage scaffolding protein [Weissella tructae]
MAFTTEALMEFGLDKDQVKKVMELKGKAIKESEKADELKTERDSLQAQLDERNKDLKKLQKSSENNAELTQQLTDLQEKYDKAQADNAANLAAVKLDGAINNALGKTTARDKDVVKKLLNVESIKMNEDGSLEGIDNQLKELEKNQEYLFDKGTDQDGYDPNGGGSSNVTPMAEALGIKQ